MDQHSLIECTHEHCQQLVPQDLFQLHMDQHLAEQLENEELLSQIQAKQQQDTTESLKRKRVKDNDNDQHEPVQLRRLQPQPAMTAAAATTTTTRSTSADFESYTRTHLNKEKGLWASPMPDSDRTSSLLTQLAFEFHKVQQQPKNNKLQRTVYLGSNKTDLIISDFWDKGWSCGYRNCQMLMSFLEKTDEMGESVIKHVINISGLQSLLERAWQEGFDPVGALQLQHRVYKTRKWIGTTEVYTLLVYLGVKCTILDFDAPKAAGPATTELLAERLFDCVQSYFEEAVVVNKSSSTSSSSSSGNNNSNNCKENNVFARMMMSSARTGKNVHMTDRPPVYLQHAGHSRTIVGIELLDNGRRNLLVFDPGRRTQRSKSSKQENDGNASNSNNRQPATISSLQSYRVDTKAIEKNSQYQLLVLGEVSQEPSSGAIQWPASNSNRFLLTEWERDLMKQVTSIRVL